MVPDGKKAVVLLSGGIDSATALALAKSQGYQVYALTLRYGQRHVAEVDASRSVAQHIGVSQHVIGEVDLRLFGGSALTSSAEVPKDRPLHEMSHGIPATYVPARNTILLSMALGWAEVLGANDIFIGANAIDYSGYPDCRPEYIEAFETMANLATKAAVEGKAQFRIHAPLISMRKSEIIRTGFDLGVDYSMTHSCYDPAPDGAACGACDSCLLRRRGFEEAGVPDPTRYIGEEN